MKDGLKILLKAYWDSKGWKDGTITEEEFKVAKKEGFMFEYPKYISHTDALKKLDVLLKRINPTDVSNAFLYSLSTRKLEYRSILGSYYFAKSIPKHLLYNPYKNIKSKYCYMCGWEEWSKEPKEYDLKRGLNVLNFERYKFGGVRHLQLDYVLFDFEQFIKLPKVIPSNSDKEILKKILQCVEKMKPYDKVGKLREIITKEKIFKSNKNEISVLLDILGICGILSSSEYPCYEDKFVDEYHRDSNEHKNDFSYPVNRWYASDGVNYVRFEKVFGYKLN